MAARCFLLICMWICTYPYVCICARIYTHMHIACLPICWGNKCKCLSVNQTGHYWLLVRAKHYRRALRMRVCTHTHTLTHANTNIHTMHIHTCLFLHCNLKWSTVWRWPICRLAPFGSAAREQQKSIHNNNSKNSIMTTTPSKLNALNSYSYQVKHSI